MKIPRKIARDHAAGQVLGLFGPRLYISPLAGNTTDRISTKNQYAKKAVHTTERPMPIANTAGGQDSCVAVFIGIASIGDRRDVNV
jgi:hypothetical protein